MLLADAECPSEDFAFEAGGLVLSSLPNLFVDAWDGDE
jgi:hypothetical protein